MTSECCRSIRPEDGLLILNFARVFAVFDGGDLVYSSQVAAAGEVGGEPYLDDLPEHYFADEIAGDAQDVRVVVLAGDLGVEFVVAEGRADAAYFISGDAHSDAGSADEDRAVNLARRDSQRSGVGQVGIVNGIAGACPEVHALMAHLGYLGLDLFLGIKSAMVTCDGNFHFVCSTS
jgi:hypothetical protein